MVFFKRYLPIISFIVGASALTFQITVLYPWHNELDRDFHKLQKLKIETDNKLTQHNKEILDKLDVINKTLEDLKKDKKL